MKTYLLTIAFLIVGVIHALPVIGVLGSEKIKSLYGLNVTDPNLLLLLQHRAVLLGVVAVMVFAAIFNPAYHGLAIGLATLSMLSYIGLAYFATDLNHALIRVAWVDVFALVVLWAAVLWRWVSGAA